MHQRENLTKEMGMKCKIITLASCLIRTVYACHDQLKKSNWCFIRALGTWRALNRGLWRPMARVGLRDLVCTISYKKPHPCNHSDPHDVADSLTTIAGFQWRLDRLPGSVGHRSVGQRSWRVSGGAGVRELFSRTCCNSCNTFFAPKTTFPFQINGIRGDQIIYTFGLYMKKNVLFEVFPVIFFFSTTQGHVFVFILAHRMSVV